jgi:hypothetical protein
VRRAKLGAIQPVRSDAGKVAMLRGTGDIGCEAFTAIAWGVGLSHKGSDIAEAGVFIRSKATCAHPMRGAGRPASHKLGKIDYDLDNPRPSLRSAMEHGNDGIPSLRNLFPAGISIRGALGATLLTLATLCAAGAGALREEAGFGSNPGNLRMFSYIPANQLPGAPRCARRNVQCEKSRFNKHL